MQPSLSIVIPTHNRAKYVIATIRAIYHEVPCAEIVVADSSQEDCITPHLEEEIRLSGRLRLLPCEGPMSVVQNFERGYRGATGKYLVFLGDDDFVHPSIEAVVKWAEANEVDALGSTLPAIYYWPDFIHRRLGNYHCATLSSKPFTGALSFYDAKQRMKEAAHDLGAGPLGMPRAYAGMVSMRMLERISEKYGSVFGGVSPDIFSSTLVAQESGRSAEFDFPFIVPGSSGKSTAGQSANGKHVGRLRANDHIGAFANLAWNACVPEFYAVQTVWSYSFIEALRKIDFPDALINYPRLYLKCLIMHPGYLHEIRKSFSARAAVIGRGRLLLQIVGAVPAEIAWVVRKLVRLVRMRIGKAEETRYHVGGLDDTLQAARKSVELFRFDPLWLT